MILVTGATGNIGGGVVQQLLREGVPVRALVRNPEKATALRTQGVELVQGDLEKPATLAAALSGVEKAFLLSPSTPQQVEQQKAFVDAAKQAGVRHLVKLSGAGASETNPQLFARWHWQVEQHIRTSGMHFTFVQPVYFMQNFLGKDTAQQIALQGRFVAPLPADLQFNVVDSRDVAAVAASVLADEGHEDKTYVVTGPQLLSSNEQAQLFSTLLGKHVQYIAVPAATFRQILLQAGQPAWLANGVVELFENVDTYVTNTVKEVAKKAPFTFAQFIQDHKEAFVAG